MGWDRLSNSNSKSIASATCAAANRRNGQANCERRSRNTDIRPGIPLGEQDLHDLRWIREEILQHVEPFEKMIVHGHTPTQSDLPEIHCNRIAVDTGAYYSGRLPAAVISLHRREDGLEVGDLSGHKLSAGQKATTVLSLPLAEGTCPIIIDQPEDDLDNEFVFEQLVPMLRASK
jgi:hypothetical protein